MAKVVSVGYTDTPISGVTSLAFPRGLVNFGANFREKSDNPGKESVLTNITSPVDRPEKIRIAYTDVPNIYNGTGVEASYIAPTKRGISVLAQVTEVISVTDDANSDYRIDLPISAHLVLKVPASEFITEAMVQTLMGRLVSSLYDTGSLTTTRLGAILRGSLKPSDI